jgi:hypothetical protein
MLCATFHVTNDVSCKEKVVKVTGIGPRTILFFDSVGLKLKIISHMNVRCSYMRIWRIGIIHLGTKTTRRLRWVRGSIKVKR